MQYRLKHLLKRAILTLKTRMFKSLEKYHFKMINDLAYFHPKKN